MKRTLLIVVYAVLIIVGPMLAIWSLNVLFKTDIQFTIWTWLATAILGAYFTVGKSCKS